MNAKSSRFTTLVLVISLLLTLLGVINDSTILTTAGVGFAMMIIMLFVASETFDRMESSTKETTKNLLEISESLKMLVEDVVERREMLPDLGISFTDNQEEISLNTGKETVVEFILINWGKIMAENTIFDIFFPPEIEILEAERADAIRKLGPNAKYSTYTGVQFNFGNSPSESNSSGNYIKLKIPKTAVKTFKIPFRCTCKDHPPTKGELTINTVG